MVPGAAFDTGLPGPHQSAIEPGLGRGGMATVYLTHDEHPAHRGRHTLVAEFAIARALGWVDEGLTQF
jgi:hypothetical protein